MCLQMFYVQQKRGTHNENQSWPITKAGQKQKKQTDSSLSSICGPVAGESMQAFKACSYQSTYAWQLQLLVRSQKLAHAGSATLSWRSYGDKWTDRQRSQKGNTQAYRADTWHFTPLAFSGWAASSIKQPTELAVGQEGISFAHINTNYENKTQWAYLLVWMWRRNGNRTNSNKNCQ